MNFREMPRQASPLLPDPGDKDSKKIFTGVIAAVKALFQRDGEKEERLRALEKDTRRGVSATTVYGLHAAALKNIEIVPITTDSPGTVNDVAFDSAYLYVCRGAATWERIPWGAWATEYMQHEDGNSRCTEAGELIITE